MQKTRVKYLACALIFMLFSCKSAIVNEPSESGTISPIDIRAPKFFWMLQPWKKGTLVTMDGRARFAKLSFVGRSRIRITPLINFPQERIDKVLEAAPEADICVTKSGARFYVADIASKTTKQFAPFRNWRYSEGMPYIFDLKNGTIRLHYSRRRDEVQGNYLPYHTIIYDVKNDNVLYESPERGESVSLGYCFTSEIVWGYKQGDSDIRGEYFFYNWLTHEITRNELTERFNGLGLRAFLGHGRNINLSERFLFANIGNLGEQKKIKVTWDENYEDVTVIPLDYLIPEGKWLNDIIFSSDGQWATTFVSGYEGLYGELLVKRVFFHLDNRYPNGISILIFADGYDEWHYEIGSFVEHPVHGWCFAEEKYLNERLYLRLYKMSDVLAEINREISK